MRRLVVCSDGTWDSPADNRPTNVWKIHAATAERDAAGAEQLARYQAGVGTRPFEHVAGGIFGWGLSRNIRDAYTWLVENFAHGDHVFLFGFSRGAYTARSLAGLIRNCGILRRTEIDRVGQAYSLYRDRGPDTHPDAPRATAFRARYSTETPIRFIGVWDTVGALGLPITSVPVVRVVARRLWGFHDVRLSGQVEFAAHALAVDEKRGPFRPTLWRHPRQAAHQVLEQTWFVGCHANVGGGTTDPGLSDLALTWMRGRAQRAGLAFRDIAPEGAPTAPIAESRTGLYRLLPAFIRPIGLLTDLAGESYSTQPDPFQALDGSVEARQRLDPSYAPANLTAYQQRCAASSAASRR